MYRIDNAKALGAKPARGAVGPNPDGFFGITAGVGTTVDVDYMNAVMDEICGVVEAAGLTLDKTDDTQLLQSLKLAGANPFANYAMFQDEKSSGTAGGTFTSGAWRTRDINTTVVNDITGASISSNQITLPAGTYRINSSAPAWGCAAHKAQLYDTTGTAVLLGGTSESTFVTPSQSGSRSIVSGNFTIGVESDLELQHQCGTTRSTDGLGTASTFSVNEIYSQVEIWKLD